MTSFTTKLIHFLHLIKTWVEGIVIIFRNCGLVIGSIRFGVFVALPMMNPARWADDRWSPEIWVRHHAGSKYHHGDQLK